MSFLIPTISAKLSTAALFELRRDLAKHVLHLPQKYFDEEKLKDLSNSIKERGILQPIIVRKSKNFSDKYEIIAGERRWQAAKKAERLSALHTVSRVDVVAKQVIFSEKDEGHIQAVA